MAMLCHLLGGAEGSQRGRQSKGFLRTLEIPSPGLQLLSSATYKPGVGAGVEGAGSPLQQEASG